MNIRKLFSGGLFLLTAMVTQAQPDTARISQKALMYADSLVKTDRYGNWQSYADLAPASVIKYYGGKDGYIGHVLSMRGFTMSAIEEDAPSLQLETLVTKNDQWQCVIRLSRYFHKDDKKFHLVTNLIAQSRDEGETWRIFDVNYNTVTNMILIFPDIMDMPLKATSILSEEQELAQQQAAANAAAPAGKKAVARKK
ncbi:MAG TPA: hypothetical protein VHE34_19675 [Puia sp.]|uniref:hypothetical protein n=1 Tax=Puia sp. TaxID=2045100 RepID=UPI002B7543EA|nr:hypothetical protein [Puia sp.]HVU97457.1 hypothetical protein [Puia sp.]